MRYMCIYKLYRECVTDDCLRDVFAIAFLEASVKFEDADDMDLTRGLTSLTAVELRRGR